MRFQRKNSKTEYLNPILKPSIFCFKYSRLLLLATSMIGCTMHNPAHSPPIEGDIDISTSNNGELCFTPLFSSAISNGDFMYLDHIKMKELAILDPNKQGGGHVLIRIKPVNKNYFILKDKQEICLNSNDPDLEQIAYKSLGRQPLSVSISGLDDRKKYAINFYRKFDYPYQEN